MEGEAVNLEDINLSIITLKKLKLKWARDKEALDLITDQMDAVKQTILETLKEAKMLSLKTETGTASITRRQTVKITDETQVKNWLQMNGWELDEYTKLDPLRTKPILENAVFQQGEVIDGTSLETSEYLSLRDNTRTTKENVQ